MLVNFYDNTLQLIFIKSLISNISIPKYKVVHDGDIIYLDYFYIYNSNIIRCGLKNNSTLNCSGILGTDAQYYTIRPYHHVFTMDLVSEFSEFIRASYYSCELHKRFGDLLRCYRDLKGINLMSMYNCFAYEIFDDLFIDGDTTETSVINFSQNNKYKVIAVPIKFNLEYTIAIDSNINVKHALVFKTPGGYRTAYELLGNKLPQCDAFKVGLFGSMRFKNPIKYLAKLFKEVNNSRTYNDSDLYQYERYLYLLIQLPAKNESSIAILEGDFTKKAPIINSVNYNQCNENINTNDYFYNPSLLWVNDNCTYAFSDTIILFLVKHSIDSRPEIEGNCSYLREILCMKQPYLDYWQNNVKSAVFNRQVFKYINETTHFTELGLHKQVTYLAPTKEFLDSTGKYKYTKRLNNFDKIGFLDAETEKQVLYNK